jgi:activator of HSP90 ATPase
MLPSIFARVVSVLRASARLKDDAGSRPARPRSVQAMSIHQEAVIPASAGQIFEYLTNAEMFATATGMPALLNDREGDPFSLFGGRVEGRQVELAPGERVVQAWRFGGAHPDTWEPGVYSIVRFTLRPEGDATRFVIDHDAIPPEWQDHIEGGYPTFYEEPLTKYFAG